MKRLFRIECLSCCLLLACSSPPATSGQSDSHDGGVRGAPDSDDSLYGDSQALDVPVPEAGRVYLKLSPPSIVTPSDPAHSNDWDLAFENFDLYTNSGPSGAGNAAAFGQLDLNALRDDSPPTVPFLSPDKAGGAFIDWYAYDGKNHALFSRYHVYGIKNGDRLWKAQILSYYSEQDNAPVSALYQIRYAELSDQVGDTHTLQIDGSAGGLSGSASAASGCIDLATGALPELAPAAARVSQDWDLCFRRDSISVNGEVGGPRGVGAVDLQADETSSEELAALEKESAERMLARFSEVSSASFSNAQFRGDHVVSAFETGVWLDAQASRKAPARAAWLVREASGERQFLVAFSEFRQPTASSPGTVVTHIKPVKQ